MRDGFHNDWRKTRIVASILTHLDSVTKEFWDMKMQPSLERALKYKEILGA